MNEPYDDEPANEEPAKVGGQKGNRNHMRHGLTAGKLPKGCQYLENQLNGFRRTLEDIVIGVKGQISLPDAASIQTALKWERHGALALRWLTKEGDKLKPMESLAFSREIAKASTERDKALASLGLNRDRIRDAWALIDATPSKGER